MSATAPICTACGTQFPPAGHPPEACPICDDPRQFVPAAGQSWTTLQRLRGAHMNAWRAMEPGLLAFATVPHFAIGQRAFLLRTEAGNVLWDCLTLLDEATEALIRGLGGLAAVAISHPHYYTTMAEWAETFGVPVWLHAADCAWVMRPHPSLRFWEGDAQALLPGVTLLRLGGHFPGGTVLHWAGGAGGRGALLAGDILQVVPDRRHVSFMRSYPNLVPLPAATVRAMVARLGARTFEAIYGAFWEREIAREGRAAVERSAARYVAAVTEGFGED